VNFPQENYKGPRFGFPNTVFLEGKMSKLKQANARDCFVCGVENPVGLHLKFYQTSSNEVTANLTVPEYYQGYPGILHGGIAAALLDEAAGRALMGSFPPRFMFTAKLEVKYRQQVPIGKPLILVGRSMKERGRIAESWAGIYNQAGELLAEAIVLLVDMPHSLSPEELEPAGWKIYHDE
jgi:acyl-coenzyme A thioesterase PaaI-like protein